MFSSVVFSCWRCLCSCVFSRVSRWATTVLSPTRALSLVICFMRVSVDVNRFCRNEARALSRVNCDRFSMRVFFGIVVADTKEVLNVNKHVAWSFGAANQNVARLYLQQSYRWLFFFLIVCF